MCTLTCVVPTCKASVRLCSRGVSLCSDYVIVCARRCVCARVCVCARGARARACVCPRRNASTALCSALVYCLWWWRTDPVGYPKVDMALQPGVGGNGSLDAVKWTPRALRVLAQEMCLRCGLSPPKLAQQWKLGKRGLSKGRFIEQVHTSFFADVVHPDLWETEGRDVASEAFDAIERLIPGTNVLHRIHMLHLEKWLTPEGEWMPKKDEAGVTDVSQRTAAAKAHVTKLRDELPRKTAKEMRDLRGRRRHLALVEARASGKPLPRTTAAKQLDWEAKASKDVAVAVRAATLSQVCDTSCQSPSSRFERHPLPTLQRWERPSRPLVMVSPRITLHSHFAWQNDHTQPISGRPSTSNNFTRAITPSGTQPAQLQAALTKKLASATANGADNRQAATIQTYGQAHEPRALRLDRGTVRRSANVNSAAAALSPPPPPSSAPKSPRSIPPLPSPPQVPSSNVAVPPSPRRLHHVVSRWFEKGYRVIEVR